MLGEIGVSYWEFWDMLPREIWNICRGYNKRREKWYRTTWQQTRWAGAMAFNAMRSKPRNPDELLPFPWDEEEKEERAKKHFEDLKRYKQKWQRP